MSFTEALPPPTPGTGAPIVPMVCADLECTISGPTVALVQEDLRARGAFGETKYKQPLRADNGRRGLTDAYQEQLDACNYLRQALEQGEHVSWLYECSLMMAVQMRKLLTEG